MGIEAIGTALKAILDDITGLRVYAPNELPDSVNELPAALIVLGPSNYHGDFDGDFDFMLRVIILLAKQDSPSAFNKIIDYIEITGTNSIPKKIDDNPTISSTCDTSKIMRNNGISQTEWGGIPYLSTEFEIAVWA